MSFEATYLFPLREVPETDGLVFAAGKCIAVVRREANAMNNFRMSEQGPNLLAGLDVPEAEGGVYAAREEAVTVSRDRNASDRTPSSTHCEHK